MNYNDKVGSWAQDLVEKHLVGKDYKVLARNWTCRFGELDLVMFDQSAKLVVFIEIKARQNTAFGEPLEGITARKQAKLAKTIQSYLEKDAISHDQFRTDFIGVFYFPARGKAKITHLKDVVLIAE